MSRHASLRQHLRHLLGVGLAVALVVVGLPRVAGIAWSAVAAALGAVSVVGMVALVGLWALGLLAHTITLTAALPDLTHRRALALSLTGSAVSNVLPLGGAAGIALNYRMVRHWGFDRSQFTAFTVVTNSWDVLAKLALPIVALPLLLLTTDTVVPHLVGGAVAAGVVFALLLGLGTAALVSPRAAPVLGRAADRVVNVLLRLLRSSRRISTVPRLLAVQTTCREVVSGGWRRLTVGMTVYTALLYALLWTCLSLTGAGLSPATVLTGFAAERLLTLANLTPGGAGVVELGLTGTLLLLGGDPVAVVPGVLLYRLLTFALEIPVGGTTLAAWWWLRRTSQEVVAI